MLCITNNSIKHQSFVYTQLNDEKVLFQTIQFSISDLFVLGLNVKQFYLTYQGITLQARVDLGEMAMKEFSTFPKAPSQSGHLLGEESYPSTEMQSDSAD